MKIESQMRLMIVLFCAVGMIGSYISGIALGHHRLQDTRIDLILKGAEVERANARVEELRARAADRDLLEHELRSCLGDTENYVNALEDIKWQMSLVINTCPGRERPPRTPRP